MFKETRRHLPYIKICKTHSKLSGQVLETLSYVTNKNNEENENLTDLLKLPPYSLFNSHMGLVASSRQVTNYRKKNKHE